MGLHELMGVPEHTIRMNQKLGKGLVGGWLVGGWVYLDNSVSSGPF